MMTYQMTRKRKESGAALALVLWAILALSTVLITVASLVDFDIDLESAASKRFAARQAALTGLAYGMHPQVRAGDPLLDQKLADGSRLHVVVQSEDARIDINRLLTAKDVASLISLFRFWGLNQEEAERAADSLQDWVDPDEFRSLNGAEAQDLLPREGYSRPENRPFLAVEEMRMVRGMDLVAKAKPNWADFFSVLSSNRLDLQDVPADLLEALGGLSHEQATEFVDFRKGPDGTAFTADDQIINGVESVASIVSLNDAQIKLLKNRFGTGGKLRRISSMGNCAGFERRIEVVVASGAPEAGAVLQWSEQ